MSEYFQKFPLVKYNFAIAGEATREYLVTDILRRVKISNMDIRAAGAFDIYTITEGDTPEIVSDKYYGTPYYHWLILMVNDVIYGLDGFPKAQYDLEQYCIAKYGEIGMYGTHHYEDAAGSQVNAIVVGESLNVFDPVTMTWVLSPISTYTNVSNYEYEEHLNENKRMIYLLKPVFVSAVVDEVSRLMAL
jgi:hypothetical protein